MAKNPPAREGRLQRFAGIVIGGVLFVLVLAWSQSQSGMGVRPLQLFGVLCWSGALALQTARRRAERARNPGNETPWWRFSLREVALLSTGFILFLGFSHADIRMQAREQEARNELCKAAEGVLGTEGRLSFEPGDGIRIYLSDRSFDDQRLEALVSLIDGAGFTNEVRVLHFGDGPLTLGSPRRWPGVTDRCVTTLLRLQGLTELTIEGAALTPDGVEKLSALPHLETLKAGGSKESVAELDATR